MIALYAALSMLVQDVIGVLLTQAESRNHGALAGGLDAVGWLIGLFTLNWSLNAVNGHNVVLRFLVLGAVTVANVLGQMIGVRVGRKFIKEQTVEGRLAALEAHTGLK